MSALIGALRATLGLDSAAFEKGANEIEKRSKKMERSLGQLGDRLTSVGKSLSVAITAPLLGVAAAMTRASTTMAAEAKQMRNSARLAGEGFEDFQRQAHAAQSVGIEFEKLGDIFKDTQDKVGDFLASGAGEMADFFENIAPKVGVTAEQFRKLGGKDALQLYYDSLVKAGVSQAEMVFYMESIADEASGLIPLLAANGREFDRLGGKAAIVSEGDSKALERYTQAQIQLEQSVRKLTIAFVNSGLLDMLTNLVTKAAGLAEQFSRASPTAFRWAVAIGAVAAALGPLLIGLGMAVKAVAPFAAAVGAIAEVGGPMLAFKSGLIGLSTAIGPLLLALPALAAVGALIYANWDKVGPMLSQFWADLKKAVGPELLASIGELKTALADLWNGPLGEAVQLTIRLLGLFMVELQKIGGPVVIAAIKALAQGLTTLFRFIGDGVRLVTSLFQGDWKTAIVSAVGVFNRLFGGLPGWIAGVMQRIVTAVKTWIVDRLGAIWDGAKAKVEQVKKTFWGLYDAVVGNSYIPDMVDGIAKQMDRLKAVMVAPAGKATEATKSAFRKLAEEVGPLLDRLFPDAVRARQYRREVDLLAQSLKAGILDPIQHAEASRRLGVEGLGNETLDSFLAQYGEPLGEAGRPFEVIQDRLNMVTGGLVDAAGKTRDATVRIAKSFKEMADDSLSALDRMVGAIKGGGFLDILSSVIGLGLQLGSVGLFGKKVATNINASVPGYAGGTRFHPGGLAVVGEKGPELVNLPRGSQVWPNGAGPGGGNVYHISGNLLTPEFWQRINAGDLAAAQAGGALGAQRIASSAEWRLR